MEQFPTHETKENSQVMAVKAFLTENNKEINSAIEQYGEGNLPPEESKALAKVRYIETQLESKQAA